MVKKRAALGVLKRISFPHAILIAVLIMTSSASFGVAEGQPEGGEDVSIDRTSAIFALGNTEYVLLHEFAHALIHDLDIPILGREEDAADTIATLALIDAHRKNPGEDAFLKMLLVATDAWTLMWEREQEQNTDLLFWDRHAISAQRYFNMVCLIYGSDPVAFAKFAKVTKLPEGRAEWCEEEYTFAKRSSDRLLEPHNVRDQAGAASARKQISVIYDPPETPLSGSLLKLLKESRLIEDTIEYIDAGIDLPADAAVRFTTCGTPAAAWDIEEREVIMCYEFLELYYSMGKDAHVETIKDLLETPSSAAPENPK